MGKEVVRPKYSYRESTSIYNPALVIEDSEGVTVAMIYTDYLDNAEKVAETLVNYLNHLNDLKK